MVATNQELGSIAHLKRSLALAGQLIELSENGLEECRDDGCLVVCGIMRDCGYKIRESAQRELIIHLSSSDKREGEP